MSTTTRTAASVSYDWDYAPSVPTLFGAFTAVAVFGWIVSVFLSGIHFFAIPQIPEGAPVSGSLEVLMSSWAYIFGVPLATLGAFYYLTTIGMAAWWFDTRNPLIIKILTPITASGVLASSYFVYLQLVPIGEICPFCMMSAAATVVLLGLEFAILQRSETPSLSRMLGESGRLLQQTHVGRVVFPVAVGILTLAAFYGVTVVLELRIPT